MKKILTFLLLATATSNYAQITFENNYPTGSMSKGFLKLVKLSTSGYKYVIADTNSFAIYNLNHTVFKTFATPSVGPISCSWCPLNIWYISEELFDTNPATIEFLFVYTSPGNITHGRVYDELGNILLSKDSITVPGNPPYGSENFISFTPSGVKMILYSQFGGDAWVYSLPGFLTCHDCTNGTVTSIMTTSNGTIQNEKISNYPNPSTDQTTVEYNLPNDVSVADLVFYNMTGQEIKRFKVTNAFHNILISTADLDSGTYYYQLQTATGFNAGKKMVVIK